MDEEFEEEWNSDSTDIPLDKYKDVEEKAKEVLAEDEVERSEVAQKILKKIRENESNPDWEDEPIKLPDNFDEDEDWIEEV